MRELLDAMRRSGLRQRQDVYEQIRATQESNYSRAELETSGVTGEDIDPDATFKTGDDHPSEVLGLAKNFPTTERIHNITYKSAMPKGIITIAGTHLVVQGTDRISAT